MPKFWFLIGLFLVTPAFADVRIALSGPMTGPQASFGEQMKIGAEIAVADINAHGGLNGEKIDLDIEDDACDPKQAVTVANRIAAQGIKYVIGHWCSGPTLVASPIYAEEGILQIDPGGTLPEITQHGITTLFRVSIKADDEGKAIADYAVMHDHPHKAYILSDQRAVTEILGKAIVDELRNADKTIDIRTDQFNGGDRDFSAIVTKAKQFGADAIFVAGYTQEIALIVRQAQFLGMKFYSWPLMGSPDFLKVVGPEGLEKSIFIDYRRPLHSPEAESVDQALDAKGQPRESYTYLTYAAFQILDQAWKKVPSGQVADIASALHSNSYATIFGDISFTANGDRPSIPLSAYRWEGSTPVALGPAN